MQHQHIEKEIPLLIHGFDLTQCMLALDYEINPNGPCHGLSHMAMQAFHLKEFDHFVRRVEIIKKIFDTPDGFRQNIEAINQKRIEFINEAKQKYLKKYKKLNAKKKLEIFNKFENKSYVKKKISNLQKIIDTDPTIDKEKRDILLEKYKNEFIYNAYLQNKIDFELNKLPLDVRLAFDIQAFFDGIAVYQEIDQYGFLFKKGKEIKKQDASRARPIVIPRKLKKNRLVKATKNVKNPKTKKVKKQDQIFCGLYNQRGLYDYFCSLQKEIDPPIPLTLILSDYSHTIAVNYDEKKQKWIVVNSANPELMKKELSNFEVAEEVFSAFVDPESIEGTQEKIPVHTIFNTEIYSTKSYRPELNTIIERWKQGNDWKLLHIVTNEKAKIKDSKGLTLLSSAVEIGDIELITSLLNLVAGPDNSIASPLRIAIEIKRLDIVNILLNFGADPNFKIYYDYGDKTLVSTPLSFAAELRRVDIINVLLKAGANPNSTAENNPTPLYFAVENGDVEIVTLLLKYGADPHAVYNNITPYQLAREMGYDEIARLIETKLENKTHVDRKKKCISIQSPSSLFPPPANNKSFSGDNNDNQKEDERPQLIQNNKS